MCGEKRGITKRKEQAGASCMRSCRILVLLSPVPLGRAVDPARCRPPGGGRVCDRTAPAQHTGHAQGSSDLLASVQSNLHSIHKKARTAPLAILITYPCLLTEADPLGTAPEQAGMHLSVFFFFFLF